VSAARQCVFVSDLHGRPDRLRALAHAIASRKPATLFLGGDLLAPFGGCDEFVETFTRLKRDLGDSYPQVFLIFGNDDPRAVEAHVVSADDGGLWIHAHERRLEWDGWEVFGYACVPPTPFGLKDWERYDVSRYVDPGCLSPEDGVHTVPMDPHHVRYATISRDLTALAPETSLDRTVWLFHAPPYRTALDRADLDGRIVDHVQVDVHVGSIAIRRFIEERQPPITLHGHIHESARLTGAWKETIGRTVMLSAAHDGPELALVTFDRERPGEATRELLNAP
jgi:uncharacterized protein